MSAALPPGAAADDRGTPLTDLDAVLDAPAVTVARQPQTADTPGRVDPFELAYRCDVPVDAG